MSLTLILESNLTILARRKSHVFEDLLEVLVVYSLAEAVVYIVAKKRLIFVLVNSLQHFQLFLWIKLHLIAQVLLLNGRIRPNWQLGLGLIAWHQVKPSHALQVVGIVIAHLFRDWLLCDLVYVLVQADIDSSVY